MPLGIRFKTPAEEDKILLEDDLVILCVFEPEDFYYYVVEDGILSNKKRPRDRTAAAWNIAAL